MGAGGWEVKVQDPFFFLSLSLERTSGAAGPSVPSRGKHSRYFEPREDSFVLHAPLEWLRCRRSSVS